MIIAISGLALFPQTLLRDERRESTVSSLYLSASNIETGQQITCRASNKAVPNGKDAIVIIDIQREYSAPYLTLAHTKLIHWSIYLNNQTLPSSYFYCTILPLTLHMLTQHLQYLLTLSFGGSKAGF